MWFRPTIALLALPCLWDRDTLRIEAEGAPELVEILVGRFERPPEEHYELRLARVEAELAAPGAALALYDDAGVACDRLRRWDDAIEWMARKRAALDAIGEPDPRHEYTYLANLGTFHVHRWLGSGRPSDLADVERARDCIAAAIELNPDAHFGRERYQLLAIEELLEPTQVSGRRPAHEPVTLVDRILGVEFFAFPKQALAAAGYADAVEGLAGLVHLGAAWESPLLWASLEHALQDRGDAFLARLAALRVVELAEAGRPPHAEFDAAEYTSEFRAYIEGWQLEPLDAWWAEARAAAEAWRASRNEYALARYARDEHPDTHPGFWTDWKEQHQLPPLPRTMSRNENFDALLRNAILVLVALVAGVIYLIVRWRRHAKAVVATEPG